ncbi:alsin [Anabrus simplex]|uniref:alsin n=1 Tax=Anabrus simplex TaxID=316456 RepID=UPI0035A39C2C
MSQIHLWLGHERISVQYSSPEILDYVVKICSVNDSVFVLTKNKSLYYGKVEQRLDSPFLCLSKSSVCALDIAINSSKLYFVSGDGNVYKTCPGDFENVEEIVLKEDAKCCIHGFKTPGHKVKVKSIAVTDKGCLFVTDNGQLWASGEHSQLNIQEDEPRHVLFFEKRLVKAVSCGSDFCLVLVQKPSQCVSEKDDTDDEENSDVFVSNCPSCLECVSSPVSQPSTSDTCPLGLHIQQSNVDHYSSSTASKDNSAEFRKSTDDSTSVSVVEESVQKFVAVPESCEFKHNDQRDVEPEIMEQQNKEEEVEDDTGVFLKSGSEEPGDKRSDSSKVEKRNEFFINTDAARQFLTRQLSWMSSYGEAGEELLVECAEASLVRPTRIIKQNVSNVASLVYEGVKTVGDRVATLSRHMSGGSETSESIPGILNEFESFEDLSEDLKPMSANIASNLRCEEFIGSSSGGTSDRGEESDVGLTERVSSLVQAGLNILAAELWSWGDVYHGQLGVGDTVKKNRPSIVSSLSGVAVTRIACGYGHALAVTMDGRAFAWGKNRTHQVTLDSAFDQSSPQQICNIPNSERARDVSAGGNHSVIMTNEGNVYYLGKKDSGFESPGTITNLEVPSAPEGVISQKHIFSSKNITGYSVLEKPVSPVVQDLTIEQSFLEEVILVQNRLIKPLQKKGGVAQENSVYENLCVCYSEVLGLTTLNVLTLWECTEYDTDTSCITMVHSVEEHVKVYKNYLNVICDIISLSGFTHIARIVDIPPKLFAYFSERLQSKKNKKSPEAVVQCALLNPLNRLSLYKRIIQSLLRCNSSSDQNSIVKQSIERKLQDALLKWEQMWEEQEKRKQEAEVTRSFWESSGRLMELLRSPERRLIRESRSHPVLIYNSGRFSTHWLVLLTDILVHVSGSTQTVHPLTSIWVEPLQDTDTLQNAFLLTMPEDSLTLYTSTASEKKEWLQDLQNAIKKSLMKSHCHQPPAIRTATYTFTKHVLYKDAKYSGRWSSGKMQGAGKMIWPDGRVYIGQFQNNLMHGFGCLEIPGISTYEGQWRDGQQNGQGTLKYSGGDIYEGHFKDGFPHGHGVRKEGHFMASVASVYVGEWVAGIKQGYGVMDDIITGEKYLGSWSNNLKNGCGLIVTLDGIYYEGIFQQGVLTGRGVMVFEDGTHYEGEFRGAGVFSGKGILTFNSGDSFDGNLHGAWNEGIKVTGTLHKNIVAHPSQLQSKPPSFGKLCVAAHNKWKGIFRQCYQQLGVPEGSLKSRGIDVQKVWENIAVLITNSRQETLQRCRTNLSKELSSGDSLNTIPQFGMNKLDKDSYHELRKYLTKAFESPHHPLGLLLCDVTGAYTATYGGVRVHPLLLSHAVEELHSITARVYEVVRLLFPALPLLGQELLLGDGQEGQDKWCLLTSEVVSAAALLHPVLLPRVHSALFVLYALHNKQEDDAYWKRLLKWNKQPDITLMAFLGIDKKFWVGYTSPRHIAETYDQPTSFSPLREQLFNEAVESLQQLKTTFSPLEKLLVIRSTFEQMTRAVQQELGTSYLWTMDDLFPVFHFVVVRSRILQLGSEIHFIEDFMEPYLQNGELGIMFTTLKACYYQILQEKMSLSS